jgi:flagellin-like hook-associated protein FlgL
MSRIIPIPTTRVGDFFVRQRLMQQVQADQLALFRLQNQVSTGQRLHLPSDDAPAALRAINLQRLLDRKGQVQTNIQASNVYLASAESRLTQVSTELSNLRGAVLSVAGTLSTDIERQAAIQQLDRTRQFLVDTANSQAQGRYLFSGSRSLVPPYEYQGAFVEYVGNERKLRSFVDLELLFETNLPGTEVFGGLSAGTQKGADLNPHLSYDTLLSTINGGAGVGKNAAVAVSANLAGNVTTSIVDLSSAVTVEDVVRLIEKSAPSGAGVTVEVTGSGLVVRSATGTISISEVAQGRTARELGIFTNPAAPATNTIIGTDLNPAVLLTTRLADLLGTKAQGRIVSADPNNDLELTATQNGDEFNDVTVEFVAGGTAGAEIVAYDGGTRTLTVQIQAGFSTASQVAAAITSQSPFIATLDHRDATSSAQAGSGLISLGTIGMVTAGGGGEPLDTDSGLILTNGGSSVALDISDAETVEDLFNLVHGAQLGLRAELNAAGIGIDIRSQLSGADLTIGENGGTTATQLGVRTFTGETKLAALNRGVGVPTASQSGNDDLLITARDGTQFSVNLGTAKSVQNVLDAINNHPDNNSGTTAVLARLAVVGNGIELVDASTAATGDLIVAAVEGSQAAEYLGFLPPGQTQTSANTPDADGNFVLASEDRHTVEVDSVFNTLHRLREALAAGDPPAIGRAIERLDQDIERVSFARAEIGARLQVLENVSVRLQDENVQLRGALSEDIDVDLVEAISNLTARQFAFEASLRTAANLLQISLLNYI